MSELPALTPRQGDLLRAIKAHISARGYAPSQRELCDLLGVNSTNSVYETQARLIRRGMLRRESFTARALVVTELGERWLAANPAPPPEAA